MSKRVYRVVDDVTKAATMVRANTRAQAVNHCVKSRYTATVATVPQIVEYMTKTGDAQAEIEEAGADSE